jgi:hypothetical protein
MTLHAMLGRTCRFSRLGIDVIFALAVKLPRREAQHFLGVSLLT